ncbi:MAG: murein biosynthesis integral membrane protein MurJ [Anaerolineaceae bacterium]|jgi:putative peptidoglycan lipid II flippase
MKKLSRLTKVSLLLAILFGAEKLLSIARIMVVSRLFGLQGVLDAFNSANNIPDMIFMMITGGALAIAFIPVLTEVLTEQGQQKAWDLFSSILNITFIATAVIAVVVAFFARPLVASQIGVAPGFTAEQIDLTAELMRLNLVATLIFSISGLVMAGLQANQHFLLPALAPLLYSLGQIFGALVLAPTEPITFGPIRFPALGMGVQGLVYGVIIGALMHLLIQVPGLIKYHFKWKPVIDLKSEDTRKVLRLMVPRVLSMFCIMMIFNIQDNLGSRLPEGTVSAFVYGWWIMQIPETLIGTAIATAVLPTLAEYFSIGKMEDMRKQIERAGQVMLALTIPIAIIASVVIQPVVQGFLGFTPEQSNMVAQVTRIFLVGIIGHSLVELFVRSFYAQQSPKYPLIGAFGTLIVYLALGIGLMPIYKANGIAAANTIAYALQAIFLHIMLNRKLEKPVILTQSFIRATLGALIGGGAAYLLLNFMPGIKGGMIAAILAFIAGILIAAILIRKELRVLGSI